jgi:bifunctional DNA-binding transcriptional regulator/antitoxin component of YhaV-PrlF toxin-antitoxin module
MTNLNLNYFTAILLKNGKITVPSEIREIFGLQEGKRYIFQYVREQLPEASKE